MNDAQSQSLMSSAEVVAYRSPPRGLPGFSFVRACRERDRRRQVIDTTADYTFAMDLGTGESGYVRWEGQWEPNGVMILEYLPNVIQARRQIIGGCRSGKTLSARRMALSFFNTPGIPPGNNGG